MNGTAPAWLERLLGIPTVRDRVVQQALRRIIEPIFEPDFHPSSYGYRPGRSGHHAIGKAELFIRRYRRDWVVDMDLSKCFDTLNHDLIIRQFRQRITDGSVLSLLRQFLESGVMVDGRRTARAKVKLLGVKAMYTDMLITIHEGRNRQVRKMVEQVGHQVVMLRRIRFGPLKLGDLPRGQWRELTAEELLALSRL